MAQYQNKQRTKTLKKRLAESKEPKQTQASRYQQITIFNETLEEFLYLDNKINLEKSALIRT